MMTEAEQRTPLPTEVEHTPSDVPDGERCEMVDLFKVTEMELMGDVERATAEPYLKFQHCPERAEWIIASICEQCSVMGQYLVRRICDHHRDLSEQNPELGRCQYGHQVVVLSVQPLRGA